LFAIMPVLGRLVLQY